MKTKKIRHNNNKSKLMRVHVSLANDIKKMQKKLQQESDKRYGKKKVKITGVFASKVLSRRSKK